MPGAAAKEKKFDATNDESLAKKKKRTREQNKKATALFAKTTMSEDGAVQNERLMEVVNTLFLPSELDEATKNTKIQNAFEALCAIKPKDDFERMLAAQMVACHHAAMESFRRASLTGQTFAGRDMALKHAQKLMTTYAKHLDTLNKHRGKGQQKVTVEHVNVAPGGQAIVGNVEAGAKTQNSSDPPALEHAPGMPMEPIRMGKEESRLKRKKTDGGNA